MRESYRGENSRIDFSTSSTLWEWMSGRRILLSSCDSRGGINFSADFKIDKLTDRHSGVNANRLVNGDFERPMITKSDIAFAGSGMDIDSKAADA